MLSVRFVRMWTGFDPEDNPLLPVLRHCLDPDVEIRQDPRSHVDIEVGSVYPSRRTSYLNMARAAWARAGGSTVDPRAKFLDPPKSANARLGIWYTPENVRPPASGWDVTLSFESTGWTPNNAYLPFWQLGTDLFGGKYKGFLGRTLTVDELTRPRSSTTASRERFCCAFIRNPHPVRMRAIEALRAIGPVDVFGLAGGRPVEDKLEIARQYRFMLCFENDLYPGYVTEKVFDAWATGAIPLWWGIEREPLLNPAAFINLNDCGNIRDFVERVKSINNEPTLMDLISSEPLLTKLPSTAPIADLLNRTWDTVVYPT